MTPVHAPSYSKLSDVVNAIPKAGKILFALDYDGTVVGFYKDPKDSVIPTDARELLLAVNNLRRGELTCNLTLVTGRTADSIQKVTGGIPLPIIGSHGLEFGVGDKVELTKDLTTKYAASAAAFHKEVSEKLTQLGIVSRVELKKAGCAIHWRECPEQETRIKGVTEDIFSKGRYADLGFSLLPGNMVLELKPSEGNKGTALETMFNEGEYSHIVFIGDDTTDQKGMEHLLEKKIPCTLIAIDTVDPETLRTSRRITLDQAFNLNTHEQMKDLLRLWVSSTS